MKTSFNKNITVKQLMKPAALLLCLAAVVACKKPELEGVITDPVIVNPISDFEVVKDPADPFKFSFKSLSSKYQKMEWRFGDDSLSNEVNPVHIYATSGKYQVDLKTISSTGNTSRRFYDINIVPDSVMQITLVKTGVLNQVKFGLTTKAVIKTILWTFGDVTPATTSTSLNPLRTYVPGSFNNVTATITTANGSTVSVNRSNATTEGMLQDITLGRDSYTVSAENFYAAGENSTMLMDGNILTKYTMGGRDGRLFTYPLIVTINFADAQLVKSYCIGSSNDNPPRDPKTWTVQGSNDGVNWEILDTRAMTKNFYDQMTALGATNDTQKYKQLFFYGIASPKLFTKYRWVINSNFGDAALQVNEFKLYK
jgi:PKD repeat protein